MNINLTQDIDTTNGIGRISIQQKPYPTLQKIEAVIVDLPTVRPHHLSMTIMQKQTMVIIRLWCSDGIEGIGEATTIGGLSYGEESPESMKLNIDTYFTPLLLGKNATNINSAMKLLD